MAWNESGESAWSAVEGMEAQDGTGQGERDALDEAEGEMAATVGASTQTTGRAHKPLAA